MNMDFLIVTSTEFVFKVVAYTAQLKKDNQPHIASQLFKSTTALGEHITQSQFLTHNKEIIDELKKAVNQVIETQYWLEECRKDPEIKSPIPDLTIQLDQIEQQLSETIISLISTS